MRRFFWTGLALVAGLLGSTIVTASTRSNSQIDEVTRSYWLAAHNLTKEQVTLLDRLEQTTQKPEAKRLRTLGGQVLLYTSSVDRFLKSNYPEPELLCSPPPGLGEIAGTDSATIEQVQVYCSLYRSTRALSTVRTRLNHQANLLTSGSGSGGRKPTRQVTKKPVNIPAAVNVSSRDVLVLVESSRKRLAQMQPAFPQDLRISITQPSTPPRSADVR
ncbi:hypothetical protein ACQ4M3_36795 [Leptolyngbya sp. AN03gr2]|uniref:hypothetical protein n=1 Tax=unclassified Leptolyngbya TaxID=2650499 RepID=UPI003D31496B